MYETERLILRKIQESDAELVEKYASDYEVAKTTLNIPHPYPKGSARDFIQRMLESEQEKKIFTFAIIEKELDGLIGLISLSNNKTHKHGELGYWIGNPFWNKGYGTEAAKVMLDFGFHLLDLNKIYALAFSNNSGSWRIMGKIGMTYEGELRQHYVRFGQYIDVVQYGILREEFLQDS